MDPDTEPESRILVVDDDPIVRELIEDYFTQYGFTVQGAANAKDARALLADAPPHLVFLDVGLPGEDGLSLARHIRERLNSPIIMISGAGETLDRIIGLEVGADDYVTKPFDPRELLARVKSVLRRYRQAATTTAEIATAVPPKGPPRVRIPGFELEMHSRRVFQSDGSELVLTRMEFDLLQVFVEHPNRVLSRDQLLNMTQNRDWDPYDRSIDIRVARLRKKLEPTPESPPLIRTVRGVGYMFIPDQR